MSNEQKIADEMSETKDPEIIYLQPECCADPSTGGKR